MCLAERIGAEVISADSVAVYRGLNIGAAKPTLEERARVRFHLIDVVDPDDSFSVARFKELAEQALMDIEARGRRPLLVGGTGLYVRALAWGLALAEVPPNAALRARLEDEADRDGTPALHRQLAARDAEAARRIHPNDRVRIVRALEVIAATGLSLSARHAIDAGARRSRSARLFGLTMAREALDRRIDARVDAMVAAGLVDEVRTLLGRGYGPGLRAMGSLGYREIAACLMGETRLDDAVALIKKDTRRFARRQMTWFRAEPGVTWLDMSSLTPEQMAAHIADNLPAQEHFGPRFWRPGG